MYKLTNSIIPGQPSNMVIRVFDNAWIPFDPDNTDYKAYLIWLEEGNTPEPTENL